MELKNSNVDNLHTNLPTLVVLGNKNIGNSGISLNDSWYTAL
jgi:hypothetical protein